MNFEDRIPSYPNRYLLTDQNGNKRHVTLVRADDPLVPGTPLNAATFNGMQSELLPAIEDGDYAGCYYRMVDGEKEWINPPMEHCVVYRTTERHFGIPVYVVKREWGQLGEAGTEVQATYADDVTISTSQFVRGETFARKSGGDNTMYTYYQLPAISDSGNIMAKIKYGAKKMFIKCFTDMSEYEAISTVWYTK